MHGRWSRQPLDGEGQQRCDRADCAGDGAQTQQGAFPGGEKPSQAITHPVLIVRNEVRDLRRQCCRFESGGGSPVLTAVSPDRVGGPLSHWPPWVAVVAGILRHEPDTTCESAATHGQTSNPFTLRDPQDRVLLAMPQVPATCWLLDPRRYCATISARSSPVTRVRLGPGGVT